MNAPPGFALTAGAPRFFAVRMALVFSAPMMVNGVALPFFPVWLETLSISDFQIGIVLAVPLFVRVFAAPAAGAHADRLNDRATVLVWSGLLSLATALALFSTQAFWPILLLYSLQGIVYAPYMPIADAVALSGCGAGTSTTGGSACGARSPSSSPRWPAAGCPRSTAGRSCCRPWPSASR